MQLILLMAAIGQFANIDLFDEVLFFELFDGFFVRSGIHTDGQDGPVLIFDTANAHGADIDLVLTADGTYGTDDAGAVIIKDNRSGPSGDISSEKSSTLIMRGIFWPMMVPVTLRSA